MEKSGLGHCRRGLARGVGTVSAADVKYDLLIRGGKLVDGSGNPWAYGDLAVKGDRIAAIGQFAPESAKRVIDARGLVVAPGFIDIHSHSDWLLLEDGDAQSKIRQGVTTEVLGEGTSAAPFKGKLVPRPVVVRGQAARITTLGEYLDALERSGISVNVASYVGLGNIWQCVMGYSFEKPNPGELEKMKELLAEAMKDGAFGLSSQLMMPPGSLATTEDLIELSRVVRGFGGIFSSHIHDEGLGVFDSVKQASKSGNAPCPWTFFIWCRPEILGRMNEVVALFEGRTVNVQANVSVPREQRPREHHSSVGPEGQVRDMARLNDWLSASN